MSTRWLASIVLGLAACGTDMPVNCPADQPDTCPDPAPSYATDVAPLIDQYCTSQCHNASGSASDQPLSTYSDLMARALDVEHQIYQCRMPEAPVTPPTVEERVTLLGWFVCGSPNN